MSNRRIMLLLIAGLVALITVGLARMLLKPSQEAQAPVVQTTQILVAAHDLPIGTILKEMDVKWVEWAANTDVSQFYVKGKDDIPQLAGSVLRTGLRSGEPLLVGQIVKPDNHGFLAAVLAPGMRAMSVQLAPSSGVAGFIFPGDHVDVILTHSFSRKDNDKLSERHVSETVLTDVRVLALDQRSDSMSSDPKVAQLATLEVSPKQAEKLALAADLANNSQSAQGHSGLSLALRSLAVDDASNTVGTTSAAPVSSSQPDAAAATAPSATTPATPPTAQPTSTTTWDSDVSPAFPNVHGDDDLIQHVHVMRGKEATDSNFEQRK